ncbi:putative disease resistance RPP13-like protein 1 isoform X2 [Quercus robur]|uniref:putative disease resistance RPP13-like protein 1 isoform X2 n=1 Tax=Quercus robur TaxID=38942 RepID=UPI002162D09F|nr:putative disease resistance RPP13-like protein 1 isoform X2 [Quercus robur]
MLLETLGGACLSPLVQVLLDRLAVPLIINFFQNPDFDETLLERLKTVLLTVNAVISDAEESEITNLVVKDWVNELKDAVYDADDLSCEIQTIALHCQLEDAKVNWDQVTGQFSAHHQSYEDIKSKLSNNEDIESRLEKIVKRLESLSKKIDLLNLKRSVARKPPIMLPSTSLVDESEVFGRGKDKEELLKSLLAGTVAENRIPVIAIVGIGGVGKTTLAQLLYNDSRAKGHFSLRAWAHVSEEFDVYKVTKIIFESVTSKICNLTDLNILQVRLKEVLTGMRFLLVLDDIWNGNFIDWDFMLSPLKAGHCSSRIIVTTRNQNVASTMKPLLTYRLPHLSDEACWELFAKHAFRSSTPEEHLILKRIGEDIVKKCKGLPLAAKTLGGLLHPEVEAEEWHAILNSKIWDLPKDKSSILPSLLLSYYDLPPHLKRCFAYCSIIPKGFEFEKEKLILMWMAEELLPQPMDKDKMEDVGVIYFHELVSRSFFQLSRDNQCFVMHDLVNDLAQFVSGEFCCKFEYGKPCGISEKTRHLSFLMDQINGPEKFVDLQELKSLRTFLPLSSSNPSNYPALSNIVCNLWLKFPKHLRALSFAYQAITELPDLKSLVHLRYLDLSHTSIAVKSGWKCPLYNLQTLLLSSCHKLTELPANIGELINLRYLDVSGTNLKKMPLEFGRLKGLQVLSNFVLSTDGGSKINELEELSHLCRKLSISKLEYVDNATDASKANLKGAKNARSCHHWGSYLLFKSSTSQIWKI